MFYRIYGKRLFDLVLVIPSSLLALPLLALVSLALKLSSPKDPIFFVQDRVGFGGTTFRLIKFRTMTHRERVPDREIMVGDPEVTPLGAWLRRFKLDEIPQLYHILVGEMSVVGPRPCLVQTRREFDEFGEKRMLVKPGLTGLAQVNGGIHISWPERWRFDAQYVDDLSFSLDVKIILQTFKILSAGEQATVKKTETKKSA